MVRFGEVADVVVGEVADGSAILPAAAARVLGHGHAEIDAALPERLVIIGAVEGDGIDSTRRLSVASIPSAALGIGRSWFPRSMIAL